MEHWTRIEFSIVIVLNLLTEGFVWCSYALQILASALTSPFLGSVLQQLLGLSLGLALLVRGLVNSPTQAVLVYWPLNESTRSSSEYTNGRYWAVKRVY